jgi:cell shape-determining protein MreD
MITMNTMPENAMRMKLLLYYKNKNFKQFTTDRPIRFDIMIRPITIT